MKWVLAAVVLAFAVVGARAQTVVVRSGEHSDFSRLVLQFPEPVEWQFGRAHDGYELRLESREVEFDLTRIFRFIPRNRIRDVSSPAPGRLLVAISCDCTGDAFEIRAGRVVIDIKNGRPDHAARFETELPIISGVAGGSELGVEPQNGEATRTGSRGTRNFNRNVAPEPILPRPVDPPNLVQSNRRGRDGDAVMARSGEDGQTPVPAPPLENLPPEDLPALLPADAYERIARFENELLQQLGRASTQGLILVDRPELEAFGRRDTPVRLPRGMAVDPVQSGSADAVETRVHVRVETAADRAFAARSGRARKPETGTACLDESEFDISSWGPGSPSATPFGDLRTQLVGEFDAPQPDIVRALARRHVFFGFGAEAAVVLSSFSDNARSGGILADLARLMDGLAVRSDSLLPGQIECSTRAAMWAILASNGLPAAAQVDKRAVLRAFSELPEHLQALIGPRLAEHFLAAEDLDTATAIRDISDRSASGRDSALELIAARLSAMEGDTAAAMSRLADIAETGGEAQAQALVQLIDQKIERGEDVAESTAMLADALSVEYRDTDLGKALTRVAIRGFAASGRIDTTLNRIRTAVDDGDINPSEALQLRAEALLAITKLPSDADFLINWMRAVPQSEEQGEKARTAWELAARRLIEIGLPGPAVSLFRSIGDLTASERQILAGAYLELQQPVAALNAISGLETKDAHLLRARAYEQKGDYRSAAAIYEQLGLVEQAGLASWKGGNWEGLPSVLGQQETVSLPEDHEFNPSNGEISIQTARALIESSQEIRGLVGRLIATSVDR